MLLFFLDEVSDDVLYGIAKMPGGIQEAWVLILCSRAMRDRFLVSE
jgi:hypothetical protein